MTACYLCVGEKFMNKVAISDFKKNWSALLEQVRKTRKPIRVTRFGETVADVVPPVPAVEKGNWLGSMADTFEIVGDVVSPVNEKTDWEALRE